MGRARARLSVAFFMQDFSGGGVEKMRLALAAGLAARGHAVTLIVVSARGPLAAQCPPGIGIVDLGARHTWQAVPSLRRYLRRAAPDVLVSSLDHNNVAALCACLCAGLATRVVITQHNALSEELRQGWRYRAIPVLYRALQPRADAVIAVSGGVADDLARAAHIPRARITVIANPVVDPARVAACAGHALPHPWFTDEGMPAFVFVGRLTAQKDPLTLMRAFARYRVANRGRLIVLGEGSLRAEMAACALRAGVGDDVHFAGYVAEPLAWIRHAHALLLTSRYEGFGNVIAEALACGTPVVAMDCPHGPAEILAGGRFGRLVAPGDAEGFARAMAHDLRKLFPDAMLRARARRYGVDHAVLRHEQLFASLRAGQPPRAFGLVFSAAGAAQLADRVVMERPGSLRCVVTPNMDHVRLLRRRDFRDACAHADIVCADGWPVAFYARLRRAAAGSRVTGCDIVHALFAHPCLPGRRVFVVVESLATQQALARALTARNVAHRWTIHVAKADLSADGAAQLALAAAIAAEHPDILLMTLGAPVSEVFVDRHAAMLPPCWALCVGQAVRVEIGLVARAPEGWRRLGLEWAWRCRQEPRRLGLRYARAAVWYPVAVMRDLLSGRLA